MGSALLPDQPINQPTNELLFLCPPLTAVSCLPACLPVCPTPPVRDAPPHSNSPILILIDFLSGEQQSMLHFSIHFILRVCKQSLSGCYRQGCHRHSGCHSCALP